MFGLSENEWKTLLKILWTFIEGICDCFGFLIVSLLTLFFALLLLFGAYKKCHKLVMSWLVAAGIVFGRSSFSWFHPTLNSLKNFTLHRFQGSGTVAHLAITGVILTTPSTFELSAVEQVLIIILPTIILCNYLYLMHKSDIFIKIISPLVF